MKMFMRGRCAELLAASAMTAHLLLCPFTKVEESFNLQATHDLLVYGIRHIDKFDHVEFPGVVPRTFLGSLMVANLSQPFSWVLETLGFQKFGMQLVTRWILGMITLSALIFFSDSVGMRFGRDTSRFLLFICTCQFHLLFYITRTLPNVYALALVLFGLGFWLRGKWQYCVFLFTLATVIFRGDTILLFAPLLLNMVLSRRLSIIRILFWGFSAGIVSLTVTILLDSYFWQRWLWPEGEVLWFNTVLNKSKEWGVSPPLWYFTSALPRALQCAARSESSKSELFCALISTLLPTIFKCRSLREMKQSFKVTPLVDWSVLSIAWPVFVYLALYSFLPHKELRFIFNAIPVLNFVSAVGLAKLYRNRDKARLPFIGGLCCLLITSFGTLFFLMAARSNYPGGEAFKYLHQVAGNERHFPHSVHIDVPAAMTGVSRFGEEFPRWRFGFPKLSNMLYSSKQLYSKDEALSSVEQLSTFDYVLTAKDPVLLKANFQFVASFDVFDGIKIADQHLAFQTKRLVVLMRNRSIRSD
ncbi:hypothetical protein PsorP6_009683 [Peronosclerospora sorghi]|uniref:Uncharacterized protein n=1 Tax=Peronosclerospora sorghi TaxID=230839 RepID=A0ACC0VZH9_9STRA|nr:hypothetical protein PsorP6_009683 [Peronosclerospora sorghi]